MKNKVGIRLKKKSMKKYKRIKLKKKTNRRTKRGKVRSKVKKSRMRLRPKVKRDRPRKSLRGGYPESEEEGEVEVLNTEEDKERVNQWLMESPAVQEAIQEIRQKNAYHFKLVSIGETIRGMIVDTLAGHGESASSPAEWIPMLQRWGTEGSLKKFVKDMAGEIEGQFLKVVNAGAKVLDNPDKDGISLRTCNKGDLLFSGESQMGTCGSSRDSSCKYYKVEGPRRNDVIGWVKESTSRGKQILEPVDLTV